MCRSNCWILGRNIPFAATSFFVAFTCIIFNVFFSSLGFSAMKQMSLIVEQRTVIKFKMLRGIARNWRQNMQLKMLLCFQELKKQGLPHCFPGKHREVASNGSVALEITQEILVCLILYLRSTLTNREATAWHLRQMMLMEYKQRVGWCVNLMKNPSP